MTIVQVPRTALATRASDLARTLFGPKAEVRAGMSHGRMTYWIATGDRTQTVAARKLLGLVAELEARRGTVPTEAGVHEQPQYLTVDQASAFMGGTGSMITSAMLRGHLAASKTEQVGPQKKRYWFTADALHAWRKAHPAGNRLGTHNGNSGRRPNAAAPPSKPSGTAGPFINAEQAAAILGVLPTSVGKLITTRGLRAKRVPGRGGFVYSIRLTDLNSWMKHNKVRHRSSAANRPAAGEAEMVPARVSTAAAPRAALETLVRRVVREVLAEMIGG